MEMIRTIPLYITRFIAACLVLFYHYGNLSAKIFVGHSVYYFGAPVNYFFFISGFVMIISNEKYLNFGGKLVNFNRKDFWVKRVARIYPMYILALLLIVLFNYTIHEIDNSIPRRIWLEIAGISRWAYAKSINFPDWSVSCEFFFYLCFPFTLNWFVKNSFKSVTLILVLVFIFNILFSFYYNHYIPKLLAINTGKSYQLLVNSILRHPVLQYSIFLLGCLCGRVYLVSPKMLFIEKYSVLILVGSLLVIVIICKYNLLDMCLIDAGVFCLAYFPFVLALCKLPEKVAVFFASKPLIFLGEISYGIYIMQSPVEHYFEYFFNNNKQISSSLQFFEYIAFLVLVCSSIYYIYEMPVKKIILKTFLSPKPYQ